MEAWDVEGVAAEGFGFPGGEVGVVEELERCLRVFPAEPGGA